MKYCPKCGQQLEDTAAFCSNCGAGVKPETPVAETPAVKVGKGLLSKKLLAGIGAALAVVITGVLALTMVGESPEKQFLSVQASFLAEKLAPVTERYETLADAERFSTDMTLSAEVKSKNGNGSTDGMASVFEDVADLLEDTSILLKVDAQANEVLLDTEITLMGTPALTGKVQYNKGKLGFILPELDENYYVADLSKLLSKTSGEEVDLTKLEPAKIPEDEIEELVKEYLMLLSGVVTKENVVRTNEKAVEFEALSRYELSDEEEKILSGLKDGFKGTIYTFTPGAEDIKIVLEQLADKLEEDQKLRGVLAKMMDEEMLTAALGQNLAGELTGTGDPEDMLDDLVDEIRSNGEEFAKAVEDAGFVWTLCLEGKQVRMIRLETEEEECAAVYANSTDESGEVTELLYYCDYGSCQAIENVYTKKGSKTVGTVSLDGGELSLKYDLDSGKTSKLNLPYGTYALELYGDKVDLEVAENQKAGVDHVISYVDSNSGMEYKVTVNLTESGSAVAPSGEGVDITDYDEAEFAQLLENMGGELIGVLLEIDEFREFILSLYWMS